MSLTLGAATKLLDNMMTNYSEWHTERAPQGKKVNSVEETSSLSDRLDAIMSMLVNGKSHVDPNNVPLASLVAQEENIDVNFIKSNNFNNNAYRNNFGSNNYRTYPSNNGNAYGNSYINNRSTISIPIIRWIWPIIVATKIISISIVVEIIVSNEVHINMLILSNQRG